MKKTVKPSPWVMIFFGVAAVLCVGISIADLIKNSSFLLSHAAGDFLVVAVFVYQAFKYFSQEKICYDENSFTVDGVTYSFSDITDVTVDSEQILRNVSTLRITVCIYDEEICSFAKNDKGAKEFIEVMKKHEVAISID